MTISKDELLKWLSDTKSQWVYNEVAKIKEKYEQKARQLYENQKETLIRRLQLLEWGKLSTQKHASVKNLKIADGVQDEINLINNSNKHDAMILALEKIAINPQHNTDPKAIRAFVIDELETCLYYCTKNNNTLVMGVFKPEEI